jgi:hypothetical protein
MRILASVLVAALLTPCAVTAQTGTADGVKALFRGDYTTAVRILRRLAEDAAEPDPIAQFFMATLYDAGLVVSRNEFQACGLYLEASKRTNPLQPQALALATLIHQDYVLPRELCEASAAGLWREPATESLTLGPDYWVRIDGSGFTIGEKGMEKTTPMALGGAGWMYLPARHTRVDIAGRLAPRHFIELLVWMPDALSRRPEKWALTWFVYEVVGTDVYRVPGDGLVTTVAAAEPPASFVAPDVARIEVTSAGEVRRVVHGQNARSILVPSAEAR